MRASLTAWQLMSLIVALDLAGCASVEQITGTCSSSRECSENQCCLGLFVFGVMPQNSGNCAPRGATRESCYVKNDQYLSNFNQTVFNDACPCLDGYQCFRKDDSSEGLWTTGSCFKQCSNTSECAAGECCATFDDSADRQKRDSYSLGRCKKLGTKGKACYTGDKLGLDVDFLCPCASGLICQDNGQFKKSFYFGKPGTCVERRNEQPPNIANAIPAK